MTVRTKKLCSETKAFMAGLIPVTAGLQSPRHQIPDAVAGIVDRAGMHR
jgi:hypothetical protein